MNKDRWNRVEFLIEQALELPPEEQAVFIEKECGIDEELRKEITSLLQYKEQAFSFIRDFSENIVPPSFEELPQSKDGDDQRINTVVGHYQITDVLGRGGMGVVYKARDTNLDRTVALKFLPSHLTRSDKDKQRFICEAKAAAALNHPNICGIHAIEEVEGQNFISMEYIDGQTLREKLESDELSPEKALNYAIQIAGALDEAHEKGIVHRDIKPENIMVDSNGRIKVMDFGLAKFQTGSKITKEGTTMGTAQYMSPEQANGEEINHRTDIWSFGVVLYKMLSGKPPFDRAYDQAIIYSILNENPESLNSTDPDVPAALNKIVLKCLEKDPNDRYQTVEEFLSDLENFRNERSTDIKGRLSNNKTINRVGKKSEDSVKSAFMDSPLLLGKNILGLLVGVIVLLLAGYWLVPMDATDPPENTIAVLPLESMSQNENDIQFTNEMHVELVNRLAGIGDLTVIARSSVLGYKPGERDFRQIGEELGVSTLMEGTVRRFEDQVMVSLELIDADNQGTIWSGSFEENVSDIFEIQSRIARQVANELHASLTQEEQERLEERPTDNPQAYQFYTRAREYLSRSITDEDNLLFAEELLNKALEKDPRFAQAWAMKAVTSSHLYWFHDLSNERKNQIIQAAEEAQKLNPHLSETTIAIGWSLYWDNTNNAETLLYLEEAIQKFPNQPMLHRIISLTHRRLGNWEQIELHRLKTLELDPLNTAHYTSTAFYYWITRDYEKAIGYIDQLREIAPDESRAFTYKAYLGLFNDGSLENYEEWWNHIHPENPATKEPLHWGYYNSLKRNWDEALQGYKNINNEVALNRKGEYLLKNYLIATILDAKEESAEAYNYYQKAQEHLESLRSKYPDIPRYRFALGKVYARIGMHNQAIKEGEKATELLPISQDAYLGAFLERELAEIYAWCGSEEEAIDKLKYLLSLPSDVNKNRLQLDPRWEPLWNHPRFQNLIAGEDEPYIEGL